MYLIHNITIGSIAETGLFITMILAFYEVDSILYWFIEMIRNTDSLSLNAEKIRAFFEIKSDIEVGSSPKKLAISIGAFSVDLQNVGFSYENSDYSLSNFNISIKPGGNLL